MNLKNQPPAPARVAILLGTMNGAKFLSEQLQSFRAQTHRDWAVYISDDGSSDDTAAIVRKFAETSPQPVTLRNGPRKGFCRNFMSLAGDPAIDADFFAFSDQDDVWYADKLERAVRWLTEIPSRTPAIYFTRTELVDEAGSPIGFSPLFSRPTSFQNALVQNIGGGNTMVFNRAAKRLLEQTEQLEVVSHDWWAYQIITGAGGIAHYDDQPSLKYRQHGSNVLGSNIGWRARLARTRMLLGGRFVTWNDVNLKALISIAGLLDPASSATLDLVMRGRIASLPARLLLFYRSGVYRQTLVDNVGMVVAMVLKKF